MRCILSEREELLTHEVLVNLVRKSAIQLLLHSMGSTREVKPGTPYYQWLSNHLSTLPHAELLVYPETQVAQLAVGYCLMKQGHPDWPDRYRLAALDEYLGKRYLRALPKILITPENYILHAVRMDDTAELFKNVGDERLRELVEDALRISESTSAHADTELEFMKRYRPSAAVLRS